MKNLLFIIQFLLASLVLFSQKATPVDEYVTERFIDPNGLEVEKIIVPGKPPDHFRMPLAEVGAFIRENNHLSGVPSAEEVMTHGANLGEMDAILLQKIEELTLYVIELKKENEELKSLMKK